MVRTSDLLPLLLAGLPLIHGVNLAAQASAASGVSFFEEKIRPLLATRCYKCHGPSKQKSGLRLDHISFLLKGGERGPALVPGKPGETRILTAISYKVEELKMPPKNRLADHDSEALRRWVAMGAPWPEEAVPTRAVAKRVFDLPERRRTHWSWRPLGTPRAPAVADPEWRREPIDRFVLRQLHNRGLRPSAIADRAILLRRVTFDLTGLPPSIAEQDAFLADQSEEAYANTVDRLLASKRFGEHWGRHWLDLVRYADSLGHEFDYKLPNAYRYRDYVIRALNSDLPYDQFVREQIAGDLLKTPRRDQNGHNESAVGTGFYWLCEQTHSPVDVRQHQSDRRDNQIDVLTKTFLGLTVGCARCHDHKFDAISTADYYALSGFLKSSRFAQIDSSPPARADEVAEFLGAGQGYRAAWLDRLDTVQAETLEPLLAAACALTSAPVPGKKPRGKKANPKEKPDTSPAGRWRTALLDKAIARDHLHPLHGFHLLRKHPGTDIREHWRPSGVSQTEFHESGAEAFVDFRRQDYSGWFTQGSGFGSEPTERAFLLRRRDGRAMVRSGGWAFSGTRGLHGQGVLRSQTFDIRKRYLHFYAFGRDARVRIVIEGFNIIRAPIYGSLHQDVKSETPRWYTVDLDMWKGRQAFLALVDQRPGALGDPTRAGGYAADGYLGVQQIWFSNASKKPENRRDYPSWILGEGEEPIDSAEKLGRRYVAAIGEAIRAMGEDKLDEHHAHLLNHLWDKQLFGDETAKIRGLRARLDRVEPRLGAGRYSPGMIDGTGEDEHIYIRGGHKLLGELVPRRILEALGGKSGPAPRAEKGSGRLRLAESILARDNPYPARVMVNRLWHHLFGRGIVPTVDNFGVLGEKPSHPELLDFLATRFITDRWSIKKTIRRMVLSRTYRQASAKSELARQRDPTNTYLSHASVRRITSESIRDSILSVSGRLDTKMYGPGVPVHLDGFTEGRGRPGQGPVDGQGRRSIYLQVTRNFLSSFLLAFDLPRPVQTRGRRNVTNVPAQALAMLNDPFVQAEARRWADRVSGASKAGGERIRRIYREALARAPTGREVQVVEQFLQGQCSIYRCKLDDKRPWQDLCHSLFNVKEFILLR